ncbi:hypothetical protein ACGYLI_05090 [Sulfitobacter sp. 1A13421]|uniref:hypothetical protein n=1 Tax=Sulfitobacter sp. 1A13421 TaxID=3368595 RepID=UPI003744F934
MQNNDYQETNEYRTAFAYYSAAELETTDPRSLRCLHNVWAVGNAMLDAREKITISALARRCIDQFGEPSAQTIYNNSSGLNPLVKKLQVVYRALSSPKQSTRNALSADQTMSAVLASISSPKHRSIIRDLFLENRQLKSDVHILDAFLKQLKAVDLKAESTGGAPLTYERGKIEFSQKQKEAVRNFLDNTLFNEGYDVRDGEIYKGRRPLQAKDFVAAIHYVLSS